MLSINIKNDWIPIINYQNHFIELDEEGNQTMQFDIPLGDTYYKLHAEMQIKDEYNLWLIKQINQLKTYATITCYINMDAWKSGYYLKSAEDVKLQTKTITDALNYIKPSGWTISNGNVRDIKRTLDLEKCTSYDLLMRAKVVYDVQYDIDALNKVITVVDLYEVIDLGVYVTPELNLKSSNYKGDSNNVVTRLYCYGADDLTFADINNGKPYVEDTSYKGTPICASWTDGRYTNMESLLADGKKKLAEMSVPSGAYTIDIVDLQAIDEKYKNLEMRLRSTVHCIINPERKIDVLHRIVKKRIYPDMPALNKIILSNQPRTLEKEWNALKENVDSVRKDGFKRETEIRQTNKDITLVAKETEENTKGIKSVEQKITPEQMLITVAESINKGNKLNTMQVIIDLLGLTIKNGGLKVYDNNNKLVLYVDEKTKKLTFNGSVSASSIIGSSISNGLNFHVDANGNMQCINAKISGHIVGGSISGDTTIDVGTDLSVGNNIYLNNTSDYAGRKAIVFSNASRIEFDFITIAILTGISQYAFNEKSMLFRNVDHVSIKGSDESFLLFINESMATIGRDTTIFGRLNVTGNVDCKNLSVIGNLTATGTKSRLVETKSHGKRMLNAVESANCYFTDEGQAMLNEDGQATIFFDPIWMETVNTKERYHVQLTPYCEVSPWIVEEYQDQFVIAGKPNTKVNWNVSALQRGYEYTRLEEYKKVGDES